MCPPVVRRRLVLLALTASPELCCWLWARLRSLSATCPPCVVGCGRASSPCPPLVRLVLLALATSPELVRHLSALCCWLWPRFQSLSATCPPCIAGCGHASSSCPPLVRLVSALVRRVLLALAAPPVLVRHLSALCCWLWPRLQSLSATCPPCVRHLSAFLALAAPPCPPLVRHVSATCPPCVVGFGHASSPCPSALCCWLWPRLRSLSAICPPCVRHLSALCCFALAAPPVLVRHLYALCPPLVPQILNCSLSGKKGWPRPQSLSALCPPSATCLPCVHLVPCVRLESALATLPNLVHRLVSATLSAMCPPCVRPCVRHVSAYVRACVQVWAPLQTWSAIGLGLRPPCLHFGLASNLNLVCHVSALPFVHHVSAKALSLVFVSSWPAVGQGSGIIRQILSHHCATHSVYCRPAGQFPLLYIHQIRPLQGHPMLEKLFGVYAGIIFLEDFNCFFKHVF